MQRTDSFAAARSAGVFEQHLGVFSHPKGSHLLARTRPLGEWVARREQFRTWPYSRTLKQAPESQTCLGSQGNAVAGINFGSQDYLGLSSHPALLAAAASALEEFGLHAASSPMLQGNTALSKKLEAGLAEMLGMEQVLLFPTGWSAGFGAITGLVRPNDHVLLDQLSHACLMQGARAATTNCSLFRHNQASDLRRRLEKIRAKDSKNAILVVTEGLFSMDSDSPDLAAYQQACREHEAVLMVDVAHDLGASGPGGTGQVGLQGMLGQVDLVMGSFSKTFASNGGFVASHDPSVKRFLGIYGGPHIFSNALSPLQAAVALGALEIVRGPEGDALRSRARTNSLGLRAGFAERGHTCLGEPSNVVPVVAGDETTARWTARLLEDNGLLANLVEYPAVSRGKARFRFQVMASHTHRQIEEAVEIFHRSVTEAHEKVEEPAPSPRRGEPGEGEAVHWASSPA